jgi:hypothetical protein
MLNHSGLLKRGGMGEIAGYDWAAVLAVADAHGLPRPPLLELLPAFEAGMLAAIAANREGRSRLIEGSAHG